jgi:hypothetical protein
MLKYMLVIGLISAISTVTLLTEPMGVSWV